MICQCKSATLNTYDEMTRSGVRDDAAMDAAVRVYLVHHPETTRRLAYQVVADWIDHAAATPATPAA